MRLVRWIIYLIVAAAALIIAVGNKQLVTLHLNPLDTSGTSVLTLPPMRLSLIIFVTLAVGFVLGGIFMWIRHHHYRKTARVMSSEVKAAQHQVEQLKKKVEGGGGTNLPALS